MKSFPRYTAALAIILAVSGIAGAARASGPMGPHGDMGRMCMDMDAKMAAKSAYAEVKLSLTDAQKVEFKALNQAMKTAGEPMKKLCAEQSATPATTMSPPARMAQMQKMMEARVFGMSKVIPAMTKFYDSLTPDQKKVADAMMNDHHGHHGH